MITFLKNHIIEYKERYLISLVLFLSLFFRIWYTSLDQVVWWDESVYIGMGKYIATWGHVGMWELFRPPLFPLFYAVLFSLHLPLILFGKITVIVASIGIIYLVYIIGESIKKWSGVFSAIFLSITPVFFFFSKTAITDIISVFFVMLSLYLYTKNKYFLTGLTVAFAFLLRFPQGLMMVALAIIVITETYDRNIKVWLKNVLIRGFYIGFGFVLLAVPYLISNQMLYGDWAKPLVLGNAIIGGYSFLYDLGIWYYPKQLFLTAPFLYLSLLSLYFVYKKEYILDTKSQKVLQIVFITALVFTSYFFWQSHKEMRYSIAFIPYLSILAGVGFLFIRETFKKDKILIVICILALVFLAYQSVPNFKIQKNESDEAINAYTKTLSGVYLSTMPNPVVFSNIRIVEFFGSLVDFNDLWNRRSSQIDGVILNSCDIFCVERSEGKSCDADVSLIQDILQDGKFIKVYEKPDMQCHFMVYKK